MSKMSELIRVALAGIKGGTVTGLGVAPDDGKPGTAWAAEAALALDEYESASSPDFTALMRDRKISYLEERLAAALREVVTLRRLVASTVDEAPKTLAVWPKVCACCSTKHSPDEWGALPLVGFVGHFRGVRERYAVELRNCSCGSTLGIDVRLQMAEPAIPYVSHHDAGTWRVGRDGTCVVADPSDDVPLNARKLADSDTEYYGGRLIAESVEPRNARVLAAAPAMFRALGAVVEATSEEEKKRAIDAARAALESVLPEKTPAG